MNYQFLFSLFMFVMYLEINPKLRGIWLRYDSNNQLIFSPVGIYNMIIYPFKNIQMWYPQNWDINVVMFTCILTFILTCLNNTLKEREVI